MSPVSIMYSLRSYNAGEVVEGVLCESRCSCLEGRAASVRGCWLADGTARARVTNRTPGTSARHERGRPALTHRCCGAPMAPPRRPAAGPVARNSVSYKIQIRASHHDQIALPTTPRRCSIILLSDPLILFHHQIARIVDIQ